MLCLAVSACNDSSSDSTDGDIDVPETEILPDGDTGEDGDIPSDGDEAVCGVGDFEKNAAALKVYHGTEFPALFGMTPGQQLAMGALVQDYGGFYANFCTGTVIASRLVLTAAHCLADVYNPADIKFVLGPDASSPLAVLTVADLDIHPQYEPYSGNPAAHDLGVLVLSESAYDLAPGLEAVPVNASPLTDAIIGKQVQNGGYGTTHDNEYNSRRFWIAERLDSYYDGEFTVNGQGQGGVCFGDSGGPAFYDFGQGLRVIGTVSWGDESCTGIDHFADVTYGSSWLEPYLAESGDCGSVDEKGACSGDTARYCQNDRLVEENCRTAGNICGENESGDFRCVPDPCNGVTFQGVCESGIAYWCQDRRIRFKRCIPCDQECGWTGAALGYYCTDDPQTEPDGDGELPVDGDTDSAGSCGGIGWLGCCDGTTARWCDPNTETPRRENCGAFGQECGWTEDYGYYCGGSGEDPSGTVPMNCP